jgi:hypothetical protein
MVHQSNFAQLLANQILEVSENTIDEASAFVRVAADWLGYQLEDDFFVDGAGDKGVDFWFHSDDGFDFFQVKSHQIKENSLDLTPMGNSGVNDLRRILEFLKSDEIPQTANKKVQDLIKTWKMALATKSLGEEPEPIKINLYLVIFAESLTPPAFEEFSQLKKLKNDFSVKNIPIEVGIHLHTIEALIDNRWRETNQEWRDKNGNKRNTINLRPELNKLDLPQWIPGHNSAVFYCKGIDLVTALADFGYQVFEPNVRAHINKSKVNAAIRKSLAHSSGRKQFRYLNNGVTLICKSFSKPSENRSSFSIVEPGIINGLQTVVSLHDAYLELSHEDQTHFEENCYVLLRLMNESAVQNVNKVVVATNTQNPMQARNLKSNTEEQVLFEKLFAELGWFYERKQGAWDAYSGDPHRWRSLSKYKKNSFAYTDYTGKTKNKYRKIDNENLAQSWLAFIGLSDEAVHKKREIFENEELYQLSFLLRPQIHAAESDKNTFDWREVKNNSLSEAPDSQLLLVAKLAQEFASIVPISSKQAREDAIDRLKINRNDPKENIDVQLISDSEYIRARVINGMSYLFVDIFGYVLFRAFSAKIYSYGNKILKTDSFHQLAKHGFLEKIDDIRKGTINSNDVLAVIYHAFVHIIDQLLGGAWKESYLSASPKSRFNYRRETRERFLKSLNELDDFMKRTQLTSPWAVHIPSKTGIYN